MPRSALNVMGMMGLLLVGSPGCGGADSEQSTAGTDGTAGSAGSAGAGAAGAAGIAGEAGEAGGGNAPGAFDELGPPVTIAGSVVEYHGGGDTGVEPGIAGVEVCLFVPNDGRCATTDVSGAFTLPSVPDTAYTALSYVKDGYVGMLVPGRPATTSYNLRMASEVSAKAFVEAAGGSWPLGDTGAVTVSGGIAQSHTLTPSGGKLVYVDSNEMPDPELTESAGGWGMFLNVPPNVVGIARVTYAHPFSLSCAESVWGWPYELSSVLAPVVRGFVTVTAMSCEP